MSCQWDIPKCLAAGVFVDAMQAHEWIEDEQAWLQAGHGIDRDQIPQPPPSDTVIRLNGKRRRRCKVSNFSNGGAKIVDVKATTTPDEFMLRITPGHGRIRKCRVLWRSDDAIRVQFIDRIASAEEPYVAKCRKSETITIMPR